MPAACHQVNLQRGFGGGEVYTAFLAHALEALGVRTVLYAHRDASFWETHLPATAKVIRVEAIEQILQHSPSHPCWFAFHTPGREHAVAPLRSAGHRLTAFAHMPLYGRDPESLRPYEVLFAVSRHVAASLQAAAMPCVYPEPLYGVAALEGRDEPDAPLHAASPYDWDTRKVRDRAFGLAYALYDRRRRRPAYARLPGVALGIVSRLTPIKQFPMLFRHLAPVLARHPQFRLEIFGAGGYASVRDLRRALAPLRERARFWGMQRQVGAIYRRIDYMMTGLPEKEALGLNVLEAQACGCPVLAVDAPPFTETVAPEVTGLLYADPRADRGAAFERLLARLGTAPFRIDEVRAPAHLARFSAQAFRARVAAMISWLGERGVLREPVLSSCPVLEDAVPLEAVRRALVVKLRHQGDVLLSSPVFSVLKRKAPHAEIDALVYADTEPMLSGHPSIREVFGIDRAWKTSGRLAQARAEWKLLSQLRARRYDLVIHLTEHWRGAWLSRALGARWAVAPRVSGRGRLWKRSFTHLVSAPLASARHVVESNLDALRRIGIHPAIEERVLTLVPGPAAEERITRLLAERGLAGHPFVQIHPSSRWRFKCWPADKMAALIDRLHGEGCRVVLTAAPDPAEAQMIEEILGRVALPVAANLAGELSLKELAALTARARLFIGVDSAPMHIAAAVGTPAVAIFGPSGADLWGPWGVPRSGRHRVVAKDEYTCRPCGLDGCGGGKVSDCLVTLEVARVWAAVSELLETR